MKRIVHILLSIFTLCFVASSVAVAQGTTPRTSSGDKALIFSINGFGDFGVAGSMAGTVPAELLGTDSIFGSSTDSPVLGFGMKYFISDRTAIRGALGFRSTSTSTPNAIDTLPDNEGSITLIGISPALEFHMVNAGPVSGYIGVFLSFATISASSTPQGIDSLKSSSSGSAFGGGGLIGAEFFPWSNISLGAEYQVGVSIKSESSEFRGTTTDGVSITEIGIGSLAVILGIYF